MKNRRFKILCIDKNGRCSFSFVGLRRNKYAVTQIEDITLLTEVNFDDYNLVFFALYEYRDLFEFVRMCTPDQMPPVIFASDNSKILDEINENKYKFLIDLTRKNTATSYVIELIKQLHQLKL